MAATTAPASTILAIGVSADSAVSSLIDNGVMTDSGAERAVASAGRWGLARVVDHGTGDVVVVSRWGIGIFTVAVEK